MDKAEERLKQQIEPISRLTNRKSRTGRRSCGSLRRRSIFLPERTETPT